ncbi:hypothetical protein KR059_000347 [Drosophila kikkawai]|nr:hypothetical protein KR059_000347 [Drosophila kikkawai]
MERQNSHGTAPVGTTQAAGQKAAVLVKCQAHAADSMLPPSSGIPPKVAPSNRPITDKQAHKWTNKVFAVKTEPTKAPIMENDRLGQAANISWKKTGQSGGRRASI